MRPKLDNSIIFQLKIWGQLRTQKVRTFKIRIFPLFFPKGAIGSWFEIFFVLVLKIWPLKSVHIFKIVRFSGYWRTLSKPLVTSTPIEPITRTPGRKSPRKNIEEQSSLNFSGRSSGSSGEPFLWSTQDSFKAGSPVVNRLYRSQKFVNYDFLMFVFI